jgi:hypothetical protein
MSFASKFNGTYATKYNGVYGYGLGTPPLQLFQDWCVRIASLDQAVLISDTWLRVNQVLRVTGESGTGPLICTLPVINTAPEGARVIVFNYGREEITIRGGRNSSVHNVDEITTTAPYFEVISEHDPDDDAVGFSNFVVIAST